MAAITTEETALYDRQIRLWGLESQTRYLNFYSVFVGALKKLKRNAKTLFEALMYIFMIWRQRHFNSTCRTINISLFGPNHENVR